MLDAHLTILPDSPFALRNNRLVQLHLATRELTAKVVLMDADKLVAGDSDYVQFRLTAPVAAHRGDRFVIRLRSPAVTIGGGGILDAFPQKHRRRKTEVLNQYRTKDSGTVRQRLELAIRERPGTFASLAQLALRADLGQSALAEANVLADKKVVFKLTPEIFLHQTELSTLTQKLKSILADYHQRNPQSPGQSTEEIHSRLAPQAPPTAWEGLLRIWEGQGLVIREEGLTRLQSFEPRIDVISNQYIELLARAYLDFGWTPLATSAVLPTADPDLARRRRAALETLVRRGELIRLDDLYHMHHRPYEEAWRLFQNLSLNGPVEPAPFRDALKTSRKVAIAVLENFEAKALVIKSGAGRLPLARIRAANLST
jgi:selenocysteine-specific elongation factor